ncbi:protein FAR1-RELATED SEQUENCE 6-like [Cornus florida]|uniref:protein FAR1-RELATED SEQUENCE 6-like n=1 Tax=Cornus florida TaxID=4283 RepID=UPI00289A4C69|nr:protein FAR1-RELATED SEQUENCE 6-like [Cornus florida]
MDDEGRLRNVFWADARCRAAYESFGDVITFDSTYLTNRYDMPFAPFVWVNHHGQSILLGCGLLSNEDIHTYTWLFESWLTCMQGSAPKTIVTDQCKAIQAAIAKVFPNSSHHLCLWHIMQKVPVKLSGLSQYEVIKKTLKSIVYESIKIDEFESSWTKMILQFNLENNKWLKSLYGDRHRWVPVFVKTTFWAGMSTTQRSESMNSFFDRYVHSKTTLKQFVEQYDNALKSKVEKENKADFVSFSTTIPTITKFSIEVQYQEVYMHDVFKFFQDELRGLMYCNVFNINRDASVSTFVVNETIIGEGGICWKEVNEVPSHYILERWRKDIKRGYTFVKNTYDDVSNSEQRHRETKEKLLTMDSVSGSGQIHGVLNDASRLLTPLKISQRLTREPLGEKDGSHVDKILTHESHMIAPTAWNGMYSGAVINYCNCADKLTPGSLCDGIQRNRFDAEF